MTEAPAPTGARRLARPSLSTVAGTALVLAGWVLGARPLGDNSFLTHLATGRIILDTGSVPSSDPYSFTAPGEPWVVQSWLMSIAYAVAEEVAGPAGIRLLVGALVAALVATLWALARPASSLIARVLLVGLTMAVGGELWSERPLMLGLMLMAFCLLAVERAWTPWLLVPVGWVWANAHGSFPLGLVLLALLALGARLDRGAWGHEPRLLGALGLGVVAGAVGPLGPALLLFPVQLVTGNEVLEFVSEWRAPTFTAMSQRLFLVQLVVAVGLLCRRPSWREGLPMAVFVVAALISVRNMAVASIVLVPAMAASMPALGRLRSTERPRLAGVAIAFVVAVAPVAVIGRLGQSDFRFAPRYPTSALAWSVEAGVGPLDGPLAAPETSGNLVDLLWGPAGATFYDDRFDMFPEDVSAGYLRLSGGRAGWHDVLDQHEITTVVWRREDALAQLLGAEDRWAIAFSDDAWVVAVRR